MIQTFQDVARVRLAVTALAAAVLVASCGMANSDVEADGGARGATSRTVILPVGTVLHMQLRNAVASDASHVEDAILADLTQSVVINRQTVVPAGAVVSGLVREADASGRVKGLASVSVTFTGLRTGGAQYDMQTSGFSQTAPATKGEDAAKIGVGAGIGAAAGALLGGQKGAAEGAAIGGGVGTGAVLATAGREVRLPVGADVTTRLTAPLSVRVAN